MTLHWARFLSSDLRFGSLIGWNINRSMWVQVHLALGLVSVTYLLCFFNFVGDIKLTACGECKFTLHFCIFGSSDLCFCMNFVAILTINSRCVQGHLALSIFLLILTSVSHFFSSSNFLSSMWVQVHLALFLISLYWLTFCYNFVTEKWTD